MQDVPSLAKQLDRRLIAWLKESRTEGHAVNGKALQLNAQHIDKTATFKASRHATNSTRQETSFGQKQPKDADQKLDSFHAFVLSTCHSQNYQLSDIYNMDGRPMKFDMPGNWTLHSAGKKTIMIRTSGA